MKNLTKLI